MTGPYRVDFLMDQVAGHVTNYRNLRRVAEADTEVSPVWWEIASARAGGRIERVHELVPFIPGYVMGNGRATLETWRALHRSAPEARFSNVRVGVLFGRSIGAVPTLLDFDVTPRQLDELPGYTRGIELPGSRQVKHALWTRLFRRAAVLQAWSRWAKQGAVERYGVPAEKVIVNPPGVDLDFWGGALPRAERSGPRRVLFVGGDFERKGGQLLLDWYRTRDPASVELHLVTGHEIPAVRGVVVHRDVTANSAPLLDLFRRADVFVLPSLGECFGIATVEAMAAGLPVIASDVGGTADIVEPDENGYIVRGGNGRDLTNALDTLLADDAMRQRFGIRSRQLAEERFDITRNAQRTLHALKALAGERRREVGR